MKRSFAALLIGLALLTSSCMPAIAPPPTLPPQIVKSPARSFAGGGKTIFANICARCHGARGQGLVGPAIIGTNANLRKFNTAQGLYNFISIAMPFDAPGSLSRREYLQAMSFLLIENGLIEPDTVIDPDHLEALGLQE